MDKIIFSTTVFPRKEIIANCKACGTETPQIYKAKTKGEAMRACARHKEWKR